LLVPEIRESIEKLAVQNVAGDHLDENHPQRFIYQKQVKNLEMFKIPAGVASLVSVLKEAIMHGSVGVRTDSAFCFKYVLDFSPPEVIKKEIIKICGALIRVVNDKFA